MVRLRREGKDPFLLSKRAGMVMARGVLMCAKKHQYDLEAHKRARLKQGGRGERSTYLRQYYSVNAVKRSGDLFPHKN